MGDDPVAEGVDRARPAEVSPHVNTLGDQPADAAQRVPVDGPGGAPPAGWWGGRPGACSMRNRENPAVALLMSPAPVRWLGCMAGGALARGEWSPRALSMAAGREGSPIQCGAVRPAEAIRAEPA